MTVQIGMIPIILRDEMAADYWRTLLKIAEIGCQGIESGQVEVDLSEASGELRLSQTRRDMSCEF